MWPEQPDTVGLTVANHGGMIEKGSLHGLVLATLDRLRALHPDLDEEIRKAYAYAVFPLVGRTSVVLGVSHGRGEVFERDAMIGVAKITQLTIGVQVGGQTFSEVLIFKDKAALDALKKGEISFNANASAVLVKAGGSGTADFKGVIAKAYTSGGMLLELSLGGQKLSFLPKDQIEAAETPELGERRGNGAAERARETAESATERVKDVAENATKHAGDAAEAATEKATDVATDAVAGASKPVAAHQGPLRRLAMAVARRVGATRMVKSPTNRLTRSAHLLTSGLEKEQEISKLLHPQAEAALGRVLEMKPALREKLNDAYGYAIFPLVGKAGAVLGATYGLGEVFERGELIGYAGVAHLTIGLQLGGDTVTVVVVFEDEAALERFKLGKVGFAADASAVLVKSGAAATTKYKGAKVYLVTEGGFLLEAAIGGQKFVFHPAALTRGKKVRVEPQQQPTA